MLTKTTIIPRTKEPWQKTLTHLITDPAELFALLELDGAYLAAAYRASKLFPLRVTHHFVAQMEKGNLQDPLLRQVLPLDAEFVKQPDYSQDPLEEKKYNPVPGLLHKYRTRVLMTVTGTCAINCRFCFRRHFPYQDNNPGRLGWEKVYTYIREHPAINEVILSGGDPLIAEDDYLAEIAINLARIPHLKRLRIHTRVPIVAPNRIGRDFLAWFSNTRLQPILVLHSNHPNEIDSEVGAAMQKVKKANITILNQTVLLKGVNDSALTLIDLNERLFEVGILPYYLHTLDKVEGASHFAVSDAQALKLLEEIRLQLPGFLVPKLVREVGGTLAKVPLG